MAGPDDLLRYPLPAGWNEEPTARITVAPAASATGLSDGPAPALPVDPNAAPSMSPLTALDPAMWPGAPAAPAQQPKMAPVDHDPFAETLKPPLSGQVMIPVDYDPFNPFDVAAIRQRASVLGNKQMTADDRSAVLNRLFDVNFGRNGQERFQWFPERWARAAIGEFGRAAGGQFPDTVYAPEGGMVSDEDLARRYSDMHAGAEGATNFAMIGGPLNMIAKGARPGGATLGSTMTGPLYHGSPRPDLSFINPSTRGPLGPGVYTSPQPNTARIYAGTDGVIYELPAGTRDIYRGNGHRTDEEWFGYKQDRERLVAAASPEKRPEVEKIVNKMDSGDGYPLFVRLSQLYGGDEAAQNLFRRAGFDGISGIVDGHEVLLFGPRSQPSGRQPGAVLGTAGAEDGKGRVSAGPIVPAPPFYSAVEKAIEDATLKQAGPEQWLGTLKNAKGVKPEEMQWIGLEDWLRERGARKPGQNSQPEPITKAELLDFVRQNKVELKEVRKYGDESDDLHDAVMEKVYGIMEKWDANAERLGRGEGVKVYQDRRAGGEWVVSVDGEDIAVRSTPKAARQYASDFQKTIAEAGDMHPFVSELANAENFPELQARHGQSGRKLPGGDNYREILLTLPVKGAQDDFTVRRNANGDWDIMTGGRRGGTVAGRLTEQQALEEARANYMPNSGSEVFRVRGHWPEDNVLAWSRVDDRAIPRAHTPEETAVIQARSEAQRKLDEVRPQIDAVGAELTQLATKLENARVRRIREDMDAGRITRLAAQKALEEYVEKPELKPLQDKLAGLIKQDKDIRAGMPPEPKPAQTRSLFIEEIQSDWHQQGRERGYKERRESRQDVASAYDEWLVKNGLPAGMRADQAHAALVQRSVAGQDMRTYRGPTAQQEREVMELDAWRDALEANNLEVFDLTLKAKESRMARTKALNDSFRHFTQEEMGEDAARALPSRFEANKTWQELLPRDIRGVQDFQRVGLLTKREADNIIRRQSDWTLQDQYKAIDRQAEADQRALEAAQRKNRSGVPDAPLKKGWHEMVLKRMIREAAEKGYDSVSWTTGTQQNKRWNLANFVSEIAYDPSTEMLYATPQRGGRNVAEHVPKDKLAEHLGKELSEKLLATPPSEGNREFAQRGWGRDAYGAGLHHLAGTDMEIGGSGMKGFYDKMLVDAANKLAKPFGGKVTSGKIAAFNDADIDANAIRYMGKLSPQQRTEIGIPSNLTAADNWWRNATATQREKVREIFKREAEETVHVLDITPTMRDSAIGKGFPLFMGGVPVVRVDHDPFAEEDRKRGQ